MLECARTDRKILRAFRIRRLDTREASLFDFRPPAALGLAGGLLFGRPPRVLPEVSTYTGAGGAGGFQFDGL